MNRHPTSADELLLDYQLDRLDRPTAERLQAEIQSSAMMAAASRNLSAWLNLLKSYESPLPSSGLVDSIMNRVENSPSLKLAAAASSLPPATDGRGSRRPILSFRELVALAACLAFVVSIAVPGFAKMRSVSQRSFCRGNMASIYQSLQQYAANFNGSLPQTAGFLPGTNWLYPAAPGAPRVGNRRNLFVVVRLGYAKPRQFICPSAGTPQQNDSIPLEKMEDFPSPAHCGFDFQNMAGPTPPLGQGGLQAILADRNPLFDNEKRITVVSPEANSHSHDRGAGQNVLSSDGRIQWLTSPRVGPNRDNIWQVEGVEQYSGCEFQQRPDDVFIVP